MFFQLPEIQRVQSKVRQLQKQKQQLQHALTRGYSQPNHVRQSLTQTIQEIIENAKKDLAVYDKIEEESEKGYLIPDDFVIDDLVFDKRQLPEWFQFVFKKEYAKTKNKFDVAAKKMYLLHGLPEKKKDLNQEIKSFNLLYERYQSLDESEKGSLNILREAQTLKNKTNVARERFVNYLSLLSSKIVDFLQENISKSLNYSNQVKDYVVRCKNQSESIINPYKGNNVEEKTFYTSEKPVTIQSHSPYCGYFRNPQQAYRPFMRSMNTYQSRLRYREPMPMPRHMNKTLSSYYF